MPEWLATIANLLTGWCPRYEKVPPTYRMVKWSRCKEATLHGPGCIWFWPLVTEKVDVNIQWKSLVTHVQTITLTDGTTVSARTLTRWKPEDILKVVNSEEDYADTVAETAQSVLVDVLGSCDSTFLKQSAALSVALTLAMQAELREIGVTVQKCKFTELCNSPAFRIINDA